MRAMPDDNARYCSVFLVLKWLQRVGSRELQLTLPSSITGDDNESKRVVIMRANEPICSANEQERLMIMRAMCAALLGDNESND